MLFKGYACMQFPTGSFLSEDRRAASDRRAQPTAFWSAAFRLHGRRAGFRRAAEGYRAYVDQPSRRSILLVLFILLSSILDAFLTLRYLGKGGSEANPAMAFVLQQGPSLFLHVKMSLTGLGAWLLAAHEHFPLAFRGLHAMAIAYGILLVVHAVVF